MCVGNLVGLLTNRHDTLGDVFLAEALKCIVAGQRFAKVLQFTLLGEASLSSLMTPLLAVRFGAPDNQKRNWSTVGIESRLKATIDGIGNQLRDREFLVGPALTLADISTALRIWSRGVGQDVPATLTAYCERLQERPPCKRATAAHG